MCPSELPQAHSHTCRAWSKTATREAVEEAEEVEVKEKEEKVVEVVVVKEEMRVKRNVDLEASSYEVYTRHDQRVLWVENGSCEVHWFLGNVPSMASERSGRTRARAYTRP